MAEPADPIARLRARLAPDGRFLRAVAVYGVGQFGLKALDLLAFALLVRALTPAEFGFVGAVALLGFMVTDVAPLGLFRVAAPRFAAEGGDVRRCALDAALAGYLAYAPAMAVLVALTPATALAAVGLGGFALALKIYLLSYLMRAFAYQELEILRMDHRPIAQALLEAVPSLLNVLLLLLLLPRAADKVLASAVCAALAWSPLFLGFLAFALRARRPRLAGLVDLLRYSGPMTVHRSLSELNNLAGRWVVLLTAGLAGAGAYTFFARLGDLLKLAQAPLLKAWIPAALAAERDNTPERARAAAKLVLAAGLALFLAALALCRPLARLVDANGAFADVYDAIPVVLFAGWVLNFYYVFAAGYFVDRRPAALAPITALAAGTNLGLTLLLVRAEGVLAAPWAAVAANLLFTLTSAWFGRRRLRFADRSVGRTAVLCALVGLAAFVADRVWHG
ncbi:lipopolysaccharide biosynthesis protein [Phenylobacterium sp.]|uniref:lipopolysaccharide biosynthesis protein n=1 Tax=Phenylobacterium sp. TaxID=1871053 RepID=UPI0035B11FFC